MTHLNLIWTIADMDRLTDLCKRRLFPHEIADELNKFAGPHTFTIIEVMEAAQRNGLHIYGRGPHGV
jgi:hypothetical protein